MDKWIKGNSLSFGFYTSFLNSFFPETYRETTDGYQAASSEIAASFSNRPWGFVINGNFAVTIFVIISAFLASVKIMKIVQNHQEIDFFGICLKRYFRLMIPVAFWGDSILLDYEAMPGIELQPLTLCQLDIVY